MSWQWLDPRREQTIIAYNIINCKALKIKMFWGFTSHLFGKKLDFLKKPEFYYTQRNFFKENILHIYSVYGEKFCIHFKGKCWNFITPKIT